jgi:hypothetical protein
MLAPSVKEMTVTIAIAASKSPDGGEMVGKLFSNRALHSFFAFSSNDINGASTEQKVVNVPVQFFARFQMASNAFFQPPKPRSDVGVKTGFEVDIPQSAYADAHAIGHVGKQNISS